MTTRTSNKTRPRSPTAASQGAPFRYGFRRVVRLRGEQEVWEQEPLTLDDVLHPQMEDYVNQSDRHYQLCHYLYTILRWRFAHDQTTVVLHDVLIDWGVPGVMGHAPDIAVLGGVQTHFPRTTFDLARSGGHPLLMMEVTSPHTRMLDVDSTRTPNKFQEYARVGVPWYVVVDLALQDENAGDPPPLLAYRLGSEGYTPLEPDDQGRVWLEPVGMFLGSHGPDVVWYDAAGSMLNDYNVLVRAHIAAEARIRELEQEVQRLRTEGREPPEG